MRVTRFAGGRGHLDAESNETGSADVSRTGHVNVWNRVAAVCLFVVLTFAGALDVFALVTRQDEYQEFDRDGVTFAEMIKQDAFDEFLTLPAYEHLS